MLEPSSEEEYQPKFLNGFPIPKIFLEETFQAAIDYKPRDDDLFIVTYPKCGTTWVQHIVALILRHGEPIESMSYFLTEAPFLEITGTKILENNKRPYAIKVHLPYHLTPRSDQAKYIYVTRNPKDCCVSYYHHMKDMPGHGYQGTFDRFFEIFLSGNIDFGDYFDHLLGWYPHRNDPNVLFVTYEEMKENPEAVVLKIAFFMDDEKYAKPLRKDRQKLNNVLKYSSFSHMKETVNKCMDDMSQMSPEDWENSTLPDEMKKLFAKMAEETKGGNLPKQNSINFIRKGVTKDWKNYFSESQSKRMDEKFAERTKSTDIPNWWTDYMS